VLKKSIIFAAIAGAVITSASAYIFSGSLTTSVAIISLGPIDAPGVNASNFKTGALTETISEEACTLTSGDKTTCYRITVTGEPVDTKIGPFCPETTSSTAAESGIWLDGSKVYDVDGAFILDLANLYGDAKWKLYDDSGNVQVTDTQEAFQGAAKPDVEEAYKYHCIEGKYEWTKTGEPVPISILVPKSPVLANSAMTSQGTDLGVTLNGLVIAASAPVDAILSAYTIAAFDDCGGHFNPGEGYHMHAYTACDGTQYDNNLQDPDAETSIIGYALDGVAVFAPLASNTTIELDECNGRTTKQDGYHYYAQSAEKNRVIKCFKGLTAVDDKQQAGPPAGGPPAEGGAPIGTPPSGTPAASSSTPNFWLIGGSAVFGAFVFGGLAVLFGKRKSAKKLKSRILLERS
jgi:YHYH protein